MRHAILGIGICVLVGCGGGGSRSTVAPTAFATGPIYDGCLAADRRAASQQLCGCIQAVADADLSPRDQSRAAAFFGNPQLAQDTRQADSPITEAFWQRYRAYADRAEAICVQA